MKPLDCSLTLVCHQSVEELLVGHLLEHPELVHGFSVRQIEGGSQKEVLHSMREQVRGRSRRVEICAVMNLEDARDLIAHFKAESPNPEIAYWITPVIEFGRLA
jgi:hypothetical protein